MARFNQFPDAEAIAGWKLRQANIPNVGTRVYSSIPTDPVFPLIVVKRIGGQPAVRQYLDRSRLQIDCWGGTKSVAFDIAQAARVALLELEQTAVTTGGGAPADAWITGVDDDLGLQFMQEAVTGRDRYLFGVEIFLHS